MAWVPLAAEGDVPDDEGLAVQPPGHGKIALFRADGLIYAIDDECPHEAGTSLALGFVDGTTIECPYHQSCFDLRTGKVLNPPANEDVRSYPVRISNGQVEVEI